MTELDILENDINDKSGNWLSCFPDTLKSLQVLNFASLNSDVSFESLEKLVKRCNSLKVLKVNRNINLEQIQRLLVNAPQLTELGTGSFSQELTLRQYYDLEDAFKSCNNLHTLSGLLESTGLYLQVLFPASANLTFLNLSYAILHGGELAGLLSHCPVLRRLWVCLIFLSFYMTVDFCFG